MRPADKQGREDERG